MKHLILVLLFYSLSLPISAQTGVIEGTIYEIDTLRGQNKKDTIELTGAYICLLKNIDTFKKGTLCERGTLTDLDGNFNIEPRAGDRYIEISSPFIENKVIDLSITGYHIGNIYLYRSPNHDSLLTPIGPRVEKGSYVMKPAIYLYPGKETDVSITHEFKGTIETTYPPYNNGWNVKARPDGSLYNFADKRNYEYLFWDGYYVFPKEHFTYESGFVVTKENLDQFLLDKLSLIGLNNKEINDFIVYWLPVLNKNDYNFIYFHINNNIDQSSVLHVIPEPDNWIRLFMEYKKVDSSFTIPEQKLNKYPRSGFTLVEWGGGMIGYKMRLQ